MTAKQLVAAAVKLADATLKKGATVTSTCYLHLKHEGDKRVIALDYNAAPFSAERAAKQAAIIMMIRATRRGHPRR